MYLWLHGCLQEINWFKEKFSSWFVGDTALEGRAILQGYLANPKPQQNLHLLLFVC